MSESVSIDQLSPTKTSFMSFARETVSMEGTTVEPKSLMEKSKHIHKKELEFREKEHQMRMEYMRIEHEAKMEYMKEEHQANMDNVGSTIDL